jgi:iron complex transport system ATP-binding protein
MSLSLHSATLRYPGLEVAHELSLAIPDGRVTALIGPNGSGKSTVLRALARLLRPASGTARLDDRDLLALPPLTVAKELALLPQSPQAPADLTVYDLAAFGRFPHRAWHGGRDASDDVRVRAALSATDLLPLADRAVATLSGGQRQRAWLALVLAQDTRYLLLDEPTASLDLAHQLEVMATVRSLNRDLGRTIAVVLHDLALAAHWADHVVVLDQGRLIAEGPPRAVLTPGLLAQVYGIDAEVLDAGGGHLVVVARGLAAAVSGGARA